MTGEPEVSKGLPASANIRVVPQANSYTVSLCSFREARPLECGVNGSCEKHHPQLCINRGLRYSHAIIILSTHSPWSVVCSGDLPGGGEGGSNVLPLQPCGQRDPITSHPQP